MLKNLSDAFETPAPVLTKPINFDYNSIAKTTELEVEQEPNSLQSGRFASNERN